MTQFSDREKAFENQYAHDQEIQFKVMARRNKLVGLWAAGLMGKEGDAAASYAVEVVKADFAEAGDEDVFRKLKGDLVAAAVDISDHRIRNAMEEKLAEAKVQIMSA